MDSSFEISESNKWPAGYEIKENFTPCHTSSTMLRCYFGKLGFCWGEDKKLYGQLYVQRYSNVMRKGVSQTLTTSTHPPSLEDDGSAANLG